MLQAHTYTPDAVHFLTRNNNEHSGKFEQMKMIILLMYNAILSGSDTNHKPVPVQKANK